MAKISFIHIQTMCLAVPGQVMMIAGTGLHRCGEVNFGGALQQVSFAYLPEVEVGDYVIVHVGFALSRVDEAEAHQTLADLEAIFPVLS